MGLTGHSGVSAPAAVVAAAAAALLRLRVRG